MPCNGATTTTYTYDGSGRRLTKATNGVLDTKFSWDTVGSLPELALERTSTNGLIRRYVQGPDGPISMTTTAGTFYYHRDPIGSIRGVTNSTGAEQWRHDYDPYGENRATTKVVTTAPTNPVQYAGEALDTESDLYYLRARMYDQRNGRFNATDPVTRPHNLQYEATYVYVSGRPGVLVDPSGKSGVPAHIKKYRGFFDALTLHGDRNSFANAKSKFQGRPGYRSVFEWRTDGCSVPNAAKFFGTIGISLAIADHYFSSSCVQHDFCYRNTGVVYRLSSGNRGTLRNRCDTRFRTEMHDHCLRYEPVCRTDAQLFYEGVRKHGKLKPSPFSYYPPTPHV